MFDKKSVVGRINLTNNLKRELKIIETDKETGTIRKEKDFTKNQFIIFLSENNPDFKAMEEFGTKKPYFLIQN